MSEAEEMMLKDAIKVAVEAKRNECAIKFAFAIQSIIIVGLIVWIVLF